MWARGCASISWFRVGLSAVATLWRWGLVFWALRRGAGPGAMSTGDMVPIIRCMRDGSSTEISH